MCEGEAFKVRCYDMVARMEMIWTCEGNIFNGSRRDF